MILIPKVFHRIWVGPYPMPEQFKAWGKTWLELNPGWGLRTWTEADLPEIGHLDEIYRACNRAQIANIMRWCIVAKHGGVYIDTDYECLQPVEPILDDVSCFVSMKKNSKYVMSAIFGAVPGHALAIGLESNIHTRDPGLSWDHGSRYLDTMLRAFPEGVTVFPAEKFCPIDKRESIEGKLFPKAVAIHHWASVTHNNLGFERLI